MTKAYTKYIKVIVGSSLGSLFESYDFFLYGELTDIFADHFFTKLSSNAAFMMSLLTYGAGFASRPIGSVVFGNFGDKIGRKYMFLVTIIVMGVATFLVGLLPTYETIGIAAPIILVTLRCIQGFALGGEYGGATTYLAEHVPKNRRGLCTSLLLAAGLLGILICLLIVILTRAIIGNDEFKSWGWRIPYLLSSLFLILSIFIRSKLQESPIFQEIKSAGKHAQTPLKEVFTSWPHIRMCLIALFGVLAGEAVIGYANGIYVYYFLTRTLKVPSQTANIMQIIYSVYSLFTYVLFGWLSDKIGRKPVILTGCLLAVLSYYPGFMALDHFVTQAPIPSPILNGTTQSPSYEIHSNNICIQILYLLIGTPISMTYGPIGAVIVELFPTKIRYTSISITYNIANGWMGGFMPSIAFGLVDLTGHKYAGLWYPIGICSISFVVGTLFMRETKDVDLRDDEELEKQMRECYVWNPFSKLCTNPRINAKDVDMITSF